MSPQGHWSFLIICWISGVFIGICVPGKVTGLQDTHNHAQGKWFCSTLGPNTGLVFVWSISGWTMFIGLTVWSRGSRCCACAGITRVQYIHIPTSYRKSPRAAHTILMLVTTFVVFYVLNSIFAFYVITLIGSYLWLMHTSCFGFMFSYYLSLTADP